MRNAVIIQEEGGKCYLILEILLAIDEVVDIVICLTGGEKERENGGKRKFDVN